MEEKRAHAHTLAYRHNLHNHQRVKEAVCVPLCLTDCVSDSECVCVCVCVCVRVCVCVNDLTCVTTDRAAQ